MAAPIRHARTTAEAKLLRKEAGRWLKELRQGAGLSQVDLAARLGFKYHSFISQIENGFGRVPSESLAVWAGSLGVPPPEFARTLLRYYDPRFYETLFEETHR